MLTRIVEAILGPRWRRLQGLHSEILASVAKQIRPEDRPIFEQQVGPAALGRLSRDPIEFWIKPAAAPLLQMPGRSTLLARATFTLGTVKARADVWVVAGQVRLIEYSEGILAHLDLPPADIALRALYRPEKEHPEYTASGQLPRTAWPPWLDTALEAHPEAVVLPSTSSQAEVTPFRLSDLPRDLPAFWASTGGVSWQNLLIYGAPQVHVRSVATKEYLVIGQLGYELIAIAEGEQQVLILWHDADWESVGITLQEALPTLLRHA